MPAQHVGRLLKNNFGIIPLKVAVIVEGLGVKAQIQRIGTEQVMVYQRNQAIQHGKHRKQYP